MKMLEKVKEKWGAFAEWISIMAPIFGLFLWVHHENISLSHRLDQTNVRIDTHFIEINKRSDQLHQEFIDLLKERGK